MSNALHKGKKMKKQNKQWTNAKAVGGNKKFYKHNLNELNEDVMNQFPNLVINSTLFTDVCNDEAGLNVFSISRNDELFFMAQFGDYKTQGGEIHLRKANDYEQMDLKIAINCKAGLCVVFQFLLEGLNNGLSVEELREQLHFIETANMILSESKFLEERAA